MKTPTPTYDELIDSLDAQDLIDNSPQQKALQAALANLDAEIAKLGDRSKKP
jgi:hypothetical protein